MKLGISVIVVLVFAIGVAFLARPQTLEEKAKQSVQTTSQPEEQISTDAQTPQDESLTLEVPNFTATATTGEEIVLADVVQDKPTIVGFWASWCHNCQRNLPIQNQLYQKYKDQVNIIEVNLAEQKSAVDRYVEGKDFDFSLVYDEQGAIGGAWQIQFTNTHFLIASDGTLIEGFPGDVTEAHFQQLIESS